ncbi:MAG: PleD family two-component system response regulator [Magnetococcales bacterium]|nr:PleD family two-component system response regulator [Magnetococcales bacterium]
MPDRQGSQERPKILIVDDEKVNLDILIDLLKPHYKTVAAKNGEQAMKRLEKAPLPDLILLDVMMPGLDGYEVCRQIKEIPAIRDIPIIFITAKATAADETKGFDTGAVDYIAKPFSPKVVLARVKTHIELKRRGDMLEQMAILDGLTGIPNRRRFDQVLQEEWERSRRFGRPFAVILMDIDHFKLYNDHYGHGQGDTCLRQVAQAINQAMPRCVDLAARYGGEEFSCILPETHHEGAIAVGGRILQSVRDLKAPHGKSKTSPFVSVSIGISSTIPTREMTPQELLEAADKALYQAKENGRNQMVCLD